MINVNMTDKAGVTLATAGKYCADNVKVTPSAEILRKDEQAKTATPTTSAQDITPDAGKALSKVTVNPITAAIVGDLDADSFAASIVAAIEGKGVDVPDGAKLDALAALIESIEAGGGGINATAGTITVASDQNNYVLNHGLGEVPKFFVIGMINNFGNLTGKTYLLIGAYGFSDIAAQYRISASGAQYSPTGVFKNTAIDGTGNKASIVAATDTTIKVADSQGTHKLIGGATYYWVAVGSGVF